jgi:RNA polymerase sigma-70 factor (ECF subfamily)
LGTSDEQLVAAWRQAGDRGALDELAARHLTTVRRMIHSMILDDAAADDLVQDVFLRAFRGLDAFQGRSKFTTWLYRIAMNTVHDTLARRRRSPIDDRVELPSNAAIRAVGPGAAAERVEFDAAVARALGTLPPKLRAAIVLVAIEELDPAAAARIEGCTRATIYWRVHEARKRLSLALAEQIES